MPGWGQAYVGSPIKAVIYGGAEQALILSIYKSHRDYKRERANGEAFVAEKYKNDRNRLSWYLAGALILAMADAYVDAHLYDFDVSENLEPEVTLLETGEPCVGLKLSWTWGKR